MSNMRVPTRPAPSIEEAGRTIRRNMVNGQKKVPPPRPPPPKFSNALGKSKSAWNLNGDTSISLIEWSPPGTPTPQKHTFGGSVSSSFSSSTSSLASSKRSLEYDSAPSPIANPWNNNTLYPFPNLSLQARNVVEQQKPQKKAAPTIIRAQKPARPSKPPSNSPPMPKIPPPSPPKEFDDAVLPFGIALYNYDGAHKDDLPLQVNDIVYLLRRIDGDWLYGRVGDREGMFPVNYIDIQVQLPELSGTFDPMTVTALYDFQAEHPGDLTLRGGQLVRITRAISESWLYGETEGRHGQFPRNFVDRVPPGI